MVADFESDKGDDDDHDDGPETDELCRQDSRVSVAEHDKVITLDIEKGQDDISPAVLENHITPALPAIAIDSVAGVDDVEQDVVEEGLKGRDRGALCGEKRGKCVGTGLTESRGLRQDEYDPEIPRLQICKPSGLFTLHFLILRWLVWIWRGSEELWCAMLSLVERAVAGCVWVGLGTFGLDADTFVRDGGLLDWDVVHLGHSSKVLFGLVLRHVARSRSSGGSRPGLLLHVARPNTTDPCPLWKMAAR